MWLNSFEFSVDVDTAGSQKSAKNASNNSERLKSVFVVGEVGVAFEIHIKNVEIILILLESIEFALSYQTTPVVHENV